KDIWTSAALNNAGRPMTVTIRAIQSASPAMPIGARGDIEIAPVNAGGSMVFWTVASSVVGPDTSKLLGFRVGDEAVIEALAAKKVAFTSILHENGRDLRGVRRGQARVSSRRSPVHRVPHIDARRESRALH